jgi:hypothetical protein
MQFIRRAMFTCLCAAALIALQFAHCSADPVVFSGQAAAWSTAGTAGQSSILYIPEMKINNPFNWGQGVDMDLAGSFYSDFTSLTRGKLYRGWIRAFNEHAELRAGLQKINFGPARLLRTLMWFDRIDPRDPLQITDGVNGILGRYYFKNNANLWAWGLAGNNNLKGLELFQTDPSRPEWGGRYQFPVPKGEFAFSYNHRYVNKASWNAMNYAFLKDGLENRYAVDGSWDVGPGVWFEASIGVINVSQQSAFYDRLYTIGTDYTLNMGPGIHILGEHFVRSAGPNMNSLKPLNTLSAGQLDFQVNMLDHLYVITYFDWQAQKLYPYVRYQRTYDKWQINLMAYSMGSAAPGAFSGNGVSCMVIYNH